MDGSNIVTDLDITNGHAEPSWLHLDEPAMSYWARLRLGVAAAAIVVGAGIVQGLASTKIELSIPENVSHSRARRTR